MIEYNKKRFIDLCISGEASPESIHLFVQEWHEKDSVMPLDDYLGMIEEEFEVWLENPKNLTHIITARKNNIPLTDYLQKVYNYQNLK
jgi:hypothetical protein